MPQRQAAHLLQRRALPELLALGLAGAINMGWWQPVFAGHRPCTPPDTVLNVGFFADFWPVSYS